jgi:hypothetical protein
VKSRSDSYQSEAALGAGVYLLLCEQGYDYLPIHTEADLIANLRAKLEELNDYTFSLIRMGTLLCRLHRQQKRRHRRKDPQNSRGLCAGAKA